MAWDPLSSGTYKARTYLLGLSSAAILANYYGLTVSDIPSLGVNFKDKPPELVPICLTIGILYFFVSFGLYAIDDLFNQGMAPYLERLMSAHREERDNHRNTSVHELLKLFVRKLPEGVAGDFAQELYSKCRLWLQLPEEHFDDQIYEVIKERLRANIPIYKTMAYPRNDQFVMELMRYLRSIRPEIQRIEQSEPLSQVSRYSLYRIIRIRVFEVALPIVVACLALGMMWWHLLPLSKTS